MSPLAQFDHKFESLLHRLPQGWEELAVEHHAFTRARQIKSPKELLRAVFAYAVADYSLRARRRSADPPTDMDFRSSSPRAIGELRCVVGNFARTIAP